MRSRTGGQIGKNMKASNRLASLFHRLLEALFSGIVLAVVASLLTTSIVENKQQKNEQERLILDIPNIYIGCNMEWMNEHFGIPQFTGEKDDYTLCAYVSEYFVIQAAFDKSGSAKAFFVTQLESYSDIFSVNDYTKMSSEGVSLCNTSYHDLPNAPMSTFGFVSNGNVRALYAEEYFSNGGGNYYSYYFASFDFGKTGGDVLAFIREFCFEDENSADDEVPREISKGNVLENRRISCPNTYGVSDLNASETCELLLNYDWFNSMQIRNKYHDTASLFEYIQ